MSVAGTHTHTHTDWLTDGWNDTTRAAQRLPEHSHGPAGLSWFFFTSLFSSFSVSNDDDDDGSAIAVLSSTWMTSGHLLVIVTFSTPKIRSKFWGENGFKLDGKNNLWRSWNVISCLDFVKIKNNIVSWNTSSSAVAELSGQEILWIFVVSGSNIEKCFKRNSKIPESNFETSNFVGSSHQFCTISWRSMSLPTDRSWKPTPTPTQFRSPRPERKKIRENRKNINLCWCIYRIFYSYSFSVNG